MQRSCITEAESSSYLIHGVESNQLGSQVGIWSGAMIITYSVLHIHPYAVLHSQRFSGLEREISSRKKKSWDHNVVNLSGYVICSYHLRFLPRITFQSPWHNSCNTMY